MVMSYPGNTDRFLSNWGIGRRCVCTIHPWWTFATQIETMKSHMDADQRSASYAAKYAQTANYWKYYIGQSKA